MTIEIIDYPTRELYEQDSILKNKDGFRVLHPDFINNDESQGHHITWVKGNDDPHNAPELVAQREQEKTNQLRKEELQNKSNITLPEMQELLRLSL